MVQGSYLEHGNKVDIIAINHFVDELNELLHKALVLFKPGSVEVEAERGSVSLKMSVEVV